MNIIEYITKERDNKGVGYKEFADALGISSQRFYQIMGQEDTHFSIARKMVRVLGQDFDIQKPDGSPAEMNVAETLSKLEDANAMFSNAEAMVEAIGLVLTIVDLPEEAHEERTETHACDCISRQAAIDALENTKEVNKMR